MIVRFLGMYKNGKSKGCAKCGTKRRVSGNMERSVTIMFPQGGSKKFLMGNKYTVTDQQGDYLKQWHYYYNGMQYYPFIELHE